MFGVETAEKIILIAYYLILVDKNQTNYESLAWEGLTWMAGRRGDHASELEHYVGADLQFQETVVRAVWRGWKPWFRVDSTTITSYAKVTVGE